MNDAILPPQLAQVKVAFVQAETAPVHSPQTMSLHKLSAMLSLPTLSSSKFGSGWMPADIDPGARTNENVRSVSALVLDIEAKTEKNQLTDAKVITGTEPPPFDEIAFELMCTGYAAILHTSYSHDALHPRYRIVFGISRPLTRDEVRPLALHVASILGLSDCADRQCMEPARLYFLPRCPADRLDQFRHEFIAGAPLDVDAMLEAARREAAAIEQASVQVKQRTGSQRGKVIEAFNDAHSPGEIIVAYGYIPQRESQGQVTRWMHPASTTGIAGVRLLPDSVPERIFSSHGNDPLADGHAHDAFDCFYILKHRGNRTAAVKDAAHLLGMNNKPAAGTVPPPPPAPGTVPPPPASVALFDAPALSVADVRDGTTTTRPLTELGNAQRLADMHGNAIRYVPEAKGWLWHDGTAWVWDLSGAHTRTLAAALARQIYREGSCVDMTQAEHCAKWARKSQTAQVINNALSLLSNQSRIRISLNQIDADPWIVGYDHARHVIDLRTGTARPATAADYVTKSLAPCTIGTPAMAVRWLAFLDQIFNDDAELIDWMQRWCGYALTGMTSEQVFLFFFGCGANGKSVFAETIRHIMGDYSRTVSSETLTETKRHAGGASPDIADLMGARLALTTETEDGSALAESLVKVITGGDAITTRKLYCEPVTFTPSFKLLMLGNHRPIIRGTDHGIWRRVRLVPFNRTFTEQERDPQLLETLKAESAHILAWMIEGCLAWQRRGLSDVPGIVAAQTADYRAEQDLIGQWLADCTTADRASEVETGEFYNSYRMWAMNAGLHPASKVSISRRLSERGFVQRQSHGRRLWCGIALKQIFGVSFIQAGASGANK